jgi:hypothetical protein
MAVAFALIANGVGVVPAIGAVLGLGQIGVAALRIGGSLLLSAAANALFARKAPTAVQAKAALALPTDLPDYRLVYGQERAVGTPLFRNNVVGEFIYGAWLLNSRPSAGPFTLYLDEREVEVTGDPFDFAGAGATATTAPFLSHVTMWIGTGEETAVPATFLSEAPWSVARTDLWLSTDGWPGATVVWLKIKAGANAQRQERWPAQPPQVRMQMKGCLVWDPDDAAQTYDDPTSWAWSENAALCTLDFIRNNPVEPWPLDLIHLSSFADARTVDDETVALNGGGSEARYIVGGTMVLEDADLEDQVGPLVAAGAADLIRIGGQLGLAAGAWRAPMFTLTDVFGDGFEFSDMRPGRDMPRAIRTTYTSRDRGYETAELPEWTIPGSTGRGVKSLPLDMVPSATQAARIQKIIGLSLLREREFTGVAPPEALDCVAGSVISINLPAPLATPINGTYKLTSIDPGYLPMGDDGQIAMLLPIKAMEWDEDIFAWDETLDEPDVVEETYDGTRSGVALPGTISVTTGPGVDLDTGGTVVPRLRFEFDPSTSGGLEGYEWQFAEDGGDWTAGGFIAADVLDGGGDVFGFLPIDVTLLYDIRVRAVALAGKSEWRTGTGFGAGYSLTGVSVTGNHARAAIAGTAPASVNHAGVKLYRAAVGAAFGTAVDVSGLQAGSPGAAFAHTVGDGAAVNLLSNGDFASDTIWTKGTGWTIAAGVAAKAAGTGSFLTQTLGTLVAASTVGVTFEVTAWTADNVRPEVDGTTTANGTYRAAVGTYYEELTVPAAPTDFRFRATATFAGSIDNVSVVTRSGSSLAGGEYDFWVVPVTTTGSEGTPSGPYTRRIT